MLELNKVYNMDCIEGMKLIPDNSIDSIVTDPPYEIGFMGKGWDSTGIANNVDMRKECLRVLKPGGHLLSFAATRTYHRMTCAIEDAGFEVRDMIEWVYGSGFPKSLNIGKAVDKLQGNEREDIEHRFPDGSKPRKTANQNFYTGGDDKLSKAKYTKGTSEWEGWGTALKPAHEPICMARKPLEEKTIAENVLKYGTGGINIDESRVEATQEYANGKGNPTQKLSGDVYGFAKYDKLHTRAEPNNIGRFPANLIHDNSEEVRECFPETKSVVRISEDKDEQQNTWSLGRTGTTPRGHNDSGNASRFFKSIIYTAKASKSERNKGCEELEEKSKVFNGQSNKPSKDMKDVEKRFTTLPKANNHPTVKPIALMEYLIKMVTKEGGTVLDPFTGSGTTLVAAKRNLYNYIGFELSKEYCDIIEARLKSVQTHLF